MGKAVPLERSLAGPVDLDLEKIRRATDPSVTGESVATVAAEAAMQETVYFLQDVAMEVPFALFAGKLKVQAFEAMRLLALSDELDELDDDQKCQALFKGRKNLHPSKIRQHPLYPELLGMVREAIENLGAGESHEEWLARVQGRARRSIDRAALNRLDPKTAGKAAAEILDRHAAKPARKPIDSRTTIELSEKTVQMIAETFKFAEKSEAGSKSEKVDDEP